MEGGVGRERRFKQRLMAKTAVGIDISDRGITGVVTEQRGKIVHAIAWHCLERDHDVAMSEQIKALFEHIDGSPDICVVGLPLSVLSVRNLALPFKEPKKIQQALPFELEDQLVTPVDEQIVDFVVSRRMEAGCQLIALTVEKEYLADLLHDFKQMQIDPEAIVPASITLAEALVLHRDEEETVLVLHADLHSITMAVSHQGTGVFYRRLPYPEEMIVHPPFSYREGRVQVDRPAEAKECIETICGSVERSLGYFRLNGDIDLTVEAIILTGPMADIANISGHIEAVLQLPVEIGNLQENVGVDVSINAMPEWNRARFDRALALSLQGLQKKASFNFRKGSFAKKRHLLRSKRQVAGVAAITAVVIAGLFSFLFIDYSSLKREDDRLRQEMRSIYSKTFPTATRIYDPRLQMEAALKEVEASETTVPLFSKGKRVLGYLADISSRIPDSITLQVSRLVIDQKTIHIKGTTDTFNNVDAIKGKLSKSQHYDDVQIVSATADKDKELIRFEIQLLLAGL